MAVTAVYWREGRLLM